jgi:hypothetical protein
MIQYSRDSIVNVIHHQIKAPIKLYIEHGHLSSAVKLIYAGVDSMAFLSMPPYKQSITKSYFVTWVEQYIHFAGNEQLTGLDIYGARCSMLHNHTIESELSRAGKCRKLGYADKMYPPIAYNPTIDKELVIVSIAALAEAFFAGIDKFLIDIFSDLPKGQVAEKRLNELVHYFPFKDTDERLSG